MYLDVIIKDEQGETIGKLVMNEKQFRTGSKGFYAQGKMSIGERRYQVQCQMVEIGSKGEDKDKDKS